MAGTHGDTRILLETDRLRLRPPLPDDVAWVAETIADPEVMRFIGKGETGALAEAEQAVARMRRGWEVDGFGRFMVVRKDDGSAIGRVGLLVWDPATWSPGVRAEIGAGAEIELGWTLARSAWGRGYATEAARAVRDWAATTLGAHSLISLIHADNERSLRVAAKLGERYERTITTQLGIDAQLWRLESRPLGSAPD